MKGQTGHLNSFGSAGGGAEVEEGGKSYLRFRIPWYSHSSSLLVSSFFRFPFLLCSLRCAGSLDEDEDEDDENDEDEDDEDEEEKDDDDDDNDELDTGNGDAEGMDANIDAGDAGRSDWRDDEVGCQRGRLIAVGSISCRKETTFLFHIHALHGFAG